MVGVQVVVLGAPGPEECGVPAGPARGGVRLAGAGQRAEFFCDQGHLLEVCWIFTASDKTIGCALFERSIERPIDQFHEHLGSNIN